MSAPDGFPRTSAEVINMLADLRGGYSPACDFCHRPTAPENLLPEEGGLWACRECWERWEREDAEAEKLERRRR